MFFGNAAFSRRKYANAKFRSAESLSDKNTVLLNETSPPAVSRLHVSKTCAKRSDADWPLLISEQLTMAPALIIGLCGRWRESSVIALKESPLGSRPMWVCTDSAPNSSEAKQ